MLRGNLRRLVVAAMLLSLRAPTDAQTVTYKDLLRSMVDLKALANPPHREEFCRQASSYDRKTRWDAEKQEIVENDANGDHGQFLRVEPAGHVLADLDGPGVITRIWSANAQGTIKIFIDGEAEPRLSAPMQDLLGGKIQPLTEPLAGVRSRGWNLYLPIPYQKHCKVVVQDPASMYYQINYRTLPKETQVESFRWPLPEGWVGTIEEVKRTLSHPGTHLAGKTAEEESFYASAGTSQRLEMAGPLAIVGIELKLDNLPQDKKAQRELLRNVLVTADWDDEENAIWAPLGDFFGTAPGLNPYPGYPTGITKEGTLYSYWYMPFGNRAVLSLRNGSEAYLSGSVKIYTEPLSVPMDQLLYFRADWRYEPSVKQFDWPLLTSKGRGRYCGVALHVFNTRTGWWGEGDEKMWIDGEKFPSTIGTGSEDYFGYAWCCNEPFFNAYHNQPLCEGPGNGNYTSVNRFQIADNVPFHESARITIEAYNRGTVTYAATTYWYAGRGATTDAKPVDLASIKWPEAAKPFVIAGAIEGEALKLLKQDPKYEIGPQDISGHGQFSRGTQVWLRPTAAGATAEFALPGTLKPGKYNLTLWVVRSWDYGIVEWSLNGRVVAEKIDGYSPEVVAKEVDCGVVEIRPGENRLGVKLTGKNEKSTGFFAGLDALRLASVD